MDNPQQQIQPTGQTIGFMDKLTYIFSKPSYLFSSVKSEGVGGALLMFIVIGLIVGGLSTLFSFSLSMIGMRGLNIASIGSMGLFSFGGMMLIPIMMVFSLVISVIITFAYAGLVHLLVKLFKGGSTYDDTYKACTYSLVPFQIISIIPFIGRLSIIYSFVLMSIGISELHGISKGKSAVSCILPAIIVIVGLLILVVFLFFMVMGAGFA